MTTIMAVRTVAGIVAAMLAGTCARAATPAPVCAHVAGEARLRIAVTNVHKAAGNITITLYPDSASRFLARTGKIARIRIPAVAPVTVACLPAPAPGFYAVAIYHDENNDRDFQRSPIGLPMEGFGFSNNADTTLGIPRFSAVRFAAKAGDNPLTIRLRYPDE